MKSHQRGVILLVVGGFAFAMFSPLCHALFRCGCEGFWGAGGKFCNIHTIGVPHCPFCATGGLGHILPRVLILISRSIVVLIPARLTAFSRLALGILAFLIVGTAVGFVFGSWTHYPAFL